MSLHSALSLSPTGYPPQSYDRPRPPHRKKSRRLHGSRRGPPASLAQSRNPPPPHCTLGTACSRAHAKQLTLEPPTPTNPQPPHLPPPASRLRSRSRREQTAGDGANATGACLACGAGVRPSLPLFLRPPYEDADSTEVRGSAAPPA